MTVTDLAAGMQLAPLKRTAPALRCFMYCRKSTEDDGRQVASIESQRLELEKAFGARSELEIVGVYEEARSAKSPGRPIFNEMLTRIEAGDAECIIAWAPDRLARNSIDGGRIIYLLDQRILRDLRFATYTFEHNSQGKFMLSIMFGQSKYYSDALSENVKRGNRTKAAKGWRPGSAPIGYLNDAATKTIVVDPVYLPMVRRMFDLALSGGWSAKQIARIAHDDWGLRSPRRRRGGGRMHHSMVHRLLTNPFYAGLFLWDGELVAGSHEPVVTVDEFRTVQAAIRRPSLRRQQRHQFTYTGLIRCGECGMAITAQRNTNRFGSQYVYYRCTRRGLDRVCRQPSIREEELERQIAAWLGTLPAGSEAEQKIRREFGGLAQRAAAAAASVRETLASALRDAQSQISELLQLRLRRLVGDAEYSEKRASLQAEAEQLARKLQGLDQPDEWFKPFEAAIPLGISCLELFRRSEPGLKRTILKSVGSNLTLLDKKLSVEAARWLSFLSILLSNPNGLGERDEVQTLNVTMLSRLLEELHQDQAALDQLHLAGEVASNMSPRPQRPLSPP